MKKLMILPVALVMVLFSTVAFAEEKCVVKKVEAIFFPPGSTISDYWWHKLTAEQRKGFGYGIEGFVKRIEHYRDVDVNKLPATTDVEKHPILLPTTRSSGYWADIPQYCTGNHFWEGKILIERNKYGFLSQITDSFVPTYMDDGYWKNQVLSFDLASFLFGEALFSKDSEKSQKTQDQRAKEKRSVETPEPIGGVSQFWSLPSDDETHVSKTSSSEPGSARSKDAEHDSLMDSVIHDFGSLSFSVSGHALQALVGLLFLVVIGWILGMICKHISQDKPPRDKRGRFQKTS